MPPSRRLPLIVALAEQLGVEKLAALEAEHVRRRPVPDRLIRKLVDEHGSVLTHREREIMVLLASGFKRQEIADELCISLSTVKQHLKRTYLKLGVSTNIEAVNAFLEEGT